MNFRDQLVAALTRAIDEVLGVAPAAPAVVAPVSVAAAPAPATNKKAKRKAKGRAGKVVVWTADRKAKRVPLFVQDATKLKTKAEIVARFGPAAHFEEGKPNPPIVHVAPAIQDDGVTADERERSEAPQRRIARKVAKAAARKVAAK